MSVGEWPIAFFDDDYLKTSRIILIREIWGGPEGSAYSTESRRLVLLAERRPASGSAA